MARQLADLIDKPDLRDRLVRDGRAVLAQFSDENRLKTLMTVLYDYRRRRACWD